MIVEFVGSTGTGKTTLTSEVQRRLEQTTDVKTAFTVIAAPLGLDRVTHPTARNLIQDVLGFLYLIPSFSRYKSAINFSLRMLARKTDVSILTINNLRSLVRKFGVYEMIRRNQQDGIILVDEGTVLLAHVLFVYGNARYSAEEIAQFANLIPLPDIIVYVRASFDSIVKRSLQRSSPPRELKSKDPVLVRENVRDALLMFEQLVKTDEIRSRIFIVDNPECENLRSLEAADLVSQYILHHHGHIQQNQSSVPIKMAKVC